MLANEYKFTQTSAAVAMKYIPKCLNPPVTPEKFIAKMKFLKTNGLEFEEMEEEIEVQRWQIEEDYGVEYIADLIQKSVNMNHGFTPTPGDLKVHYENRPVSHVKYVAAHTRTFIDTAKLERKRREKERLVRKSDPTVRWTKELIQLKMADNEVERNY